MTFRTSVLLLACAISHGADAMRTKLSQGQVMSSMGFEGYLWRQGNDLRFKWSDGPIEGDGITILAKAAPASVVKGWELKLAPKTIKRDVNYPAEMHTGLDNFFVMCRKKAITITLVAPVVKLFFFNEGQRITMVEAGQSVNVQEYTYAGIVPGDSEKADDLNKIEAVQFFVFKDAVESAAGRISKLDQYDKLPKLTEYLEAPEEAVAGSIVVSEDIDTTTTTSNDAVSNDASANGSPGKQGCYLVIEKVTGATGGFTLSQMYAKDGSMFSSGDKVPVAFFEPSEGKVAPNSWKYNTGNRRVLLRGTMAGGGQMPKDYLQHVASFINDGRKMEGKFTLLPDSKVKVIFMIKEGAGVKVHAVVNEAIELLDKDYVAVLDEKEKKLDDEGWTVGNFINQVKKLGFLFSWVK